MSEIIFLAKSFVLTVIVVVLMQIKLGPNTVEEKTMLWVKNSNITAPLQEVANGAVKVLEQVWQKTLGKIDSNFFKRKVGSDNTPGQRSLGFEIERSKEYLKEQAEKARRRAREMLDEEQD